MNCQEFEELSGAYILDALPPEERKLAEEHVAQCDPCAQVLQELQLAVDALSLSVPIVEPSASLKERILTSVQSDVVPDPATRLQQPKQSVAAVKAIPQRRRQGWSTQLLAIAALILLVLFSAMTVWNIVLQQQISSLTASISPINYPIQSVPPGSQATGKLTCFPKQEICVLAMHGLPRLEGTQVYQGWLLQGKQPTSIGQLNVHDGIATVDFQGSIGHYDTTAISIEPGPGISPDAPKGQIVAVGSVNRSPSSTS